MKENALKNLNIPTIQKDELYTGYLLRLSVLNHLDTSDLKHVTDNQDLSKVKLLNDVYSIADVMKPAMTAIDIYKNNTFYQLKRYTLSKKNQEYTFQQIERSREKQFFHYFSDFIKSTNYCPYCAKEDINRIGSFYQRTYHNYPAVRACYKHECKLVSNTDDILSINPENASNEAVSYAKWVYTISTFADIEPCCEKTQTVISDKVQSCLLELERTWPSQYLRYLQVAKYRFQKYTLNNQDLIYFMYLLWKDNIEEFHQMYKNIS